MTAAGAPDPLEVVWPLGRSTAEAVTLSDRTDGLDGASVGLVWNYVLKGDEIFEVLKEELGARFEGLRFVDYPAFGNIHGPDENAVVAALPDRIVAEEVDSVIIATGA